MKALKTIVATAVITVAATTAAFGGLHLGQPSANAASPSAGQPTTRQATYAVRLSEKQLEHLADLLGGRNATALHTQRSQHEAAHTEHAATHDQSHVSTNGSTTTTRHSETHQRCTTSVSHDGDHSGTHDGGCADGGSGCD